MTGVIEPAPSVRRSQLPAAVDELVAHAGIVVVFLRDSGYNAQAKTKAQALADAAGRTLGGVVSIVEGGGQTPLPFAVGAAPKDSTPIQPGTEDVQATVTVTYALG